MWVIQMKDDNRLSDSALNVLDEIRVQALDNILKRKEDMNPFQADALERHKRQTEKKIASRKQEAKQKNTPFAELLKGYKVEG